jgi:hypothetical protein
VGLLELSDGGPRSKLSLRSVACLVVCLLRTRVGLLVLHAPSGSTVALIDAAEAHTRLERFFFAMALATNNPATIARTTATITPTTTGTILDESEAPSLVDESVWAPTGGGPVVVAVIVVPAVVEDRGCVRVVGEQLAKRAHDVQLSHPPGSSHAALREALPAKQAKHGQHAETHACAIGPLQLRLGSNGVACHGCLHSDTLAVVFVAQLQTSTASAVVHSRWVSRLHGRAVTVAPAG